MEPLTHLLAIPLPLSPTGPAIGSLLSPLRDQLPGDPVIRSSLWPALQNPYQYPRNATATGWTQHEEVGSEICPYARAAVHCLDVLQAFVFNAQRPEKIHISAFLAIKDLAEGEQGTSSGTSLTLQNSSSQNEGESKGTEFAISSCESDRDPAFSNAADFIVGMKELKLMFIENNEDPGFSASVIVDINVMEDLRYERTEDDNKEVIALAIVTGHILLRLAGVESQGSFIKVHREQPMAPSDEPDGRILVSARWPDLPPSVLKRAHCLRQSWTGASQDFLKLRDVVENITIKDGTRNIILLGRTGSGKSYTGNWILRQICADDSVQFMESESGSMTSFVEKLPRNGNYCVWDTPGLDDAYGRDQRYLDDIEKSILEMGTLSVIIMCFGSIERIELSVRKQIADYAKVIGTDMAARLMVFVNRQAGSVTKFQKKSLIRAMKKEGNLAVAEDQIYDMGSNAQDLDGTRYITCQALLRMCGMPGLKMSYVDRLHHGLLEIQKLEFQEVRKEAEDMLVKLSSDLLWEKFGKQNRARPLSLLASTGTTLVLSDRCLYKMKDEKVVIEHVLELPENAITMYNRFKVFMQGFGSRSRHVLRLVELVKSMRLVFMEMPTDRKVENGGLMRKVLRIRYKLWVVSDALAEDVKQHIQKAAGLAGETCVSAFPRLATRRSGPTRRSR